MLLVHIRQTDQWKGGESPEINANRFRNVLYDSYGENCLTQCIVGTGGRAGEQPEENNVGSLTNAAKFQMGQRFKH